MTTLTIPNTFLPSTTISSTAMNANFTAVQAAVQASVAIDGTDAFTGVVKGPNGAAAAPTWSFSTDTNIGMYRKGADQLAFSTNGIEAGYFDTDQSLRLATDLYIADDLFVTDDATISGDLAVTLTATVAGLLTSSGGALFTGAAALATLRRTANTSSVDQALVFERGSGAGNDGYLSLRGDAANGVAGLVFGAGAVDVLEANQDYVAFSRQASFGETALTDAASIAWDLKAASCARVTLGGNRALAAATNQRAGATYVLRIVQDATGGRTLTFDTNYKFQNGVDPTISTAANSVSLLTCYSDGTNMYCACTTAMS